MADDLIVFPGMLDFQRDLKKLELGLDRHLRKRLKDAGQGTAEQAKSEALSRGLYSTRDRVHLSEKNVAIATTKQVVIRNKAVNQDKYRYPGVYEYGGSETRFSRGQHREIRNRSEQGARLKNMGTSLLPGFGPRAFIAPAIIKTLPDFQEKLTEAIDETARMAGFK